MKVSLTDNDLMVQADFAESYKNDQQDAIQNTYFGNQCFSIFMACCYFKVTNSNVIDGKNTNSNATVKSVVFRKVKSGQMVMNSSQEFSEAVKSFVPSINAVYLPKSESIIEPKDTECTKKINDTLKMYKLERKDNANGNLHIIFFKIADDGNVQWYGGENDIICGHDKSSKSDNQCAKCDGPYKEE